MHVVIERLDNSYIVFTKIYKCLAMQAPLNTMKTKLKVNEQLRKCVIRPNLITILIFIQKKWKKWNKCISHQQPK
jgi:hypothetical protein